MEYFNLWGLVFLLIILAPNLLFVARYKSVSATWHNRAVEAIEQIGRIGCVVFMVLKIPRVYFDFWSETAFSVYLCVNVALAALYCVLWGVFWKNNSLVKALCLSILPSVIFLFSGIMSRSILLVVSVLLFAPAHILISCKNADKSRKRAGN